MAYSARAIANYFLDLAEADGKTLSPLQIQKLVFIAHGWHLAIADEPLVDDEYAEAWDYGPVFPSLYHAFKHFGRGPIKDRATAMDTINKMNFRPVIPTISENDENTKTLLRRVWNLYGQRFSGLQLSDMTHADNTPWDQTRKQVGHIRNADIDNDIIKEHYKKMAEENRRRRDQQANR